MIAPVEFIIVVFNNLHSGAYKEGVATWKIIFMLGALRFLINWHVFLGKKKRKICLSGLVCYCGGNVYRKYWYDTPEKTISVLACCNCGLALTWPAPLQNEGLVKYYSETKDYKDYCDRISVFRELCERDIKLLKKHKSSGKLLDVGCHIGLFVSESRKRGFEARGIDFSEEGIRLGEKKLDLKGLLNIGTINDQSYPSNYWDVITYIHCFEHLDHPNVELQEIHRVIKPDGVLFIDVPRFFSVWRFFAGAKWYGFAPFQYIWQFGKKGIVSLLERNNFKVVKVYTRINMYHKASFNLKGFLKIGLKIISFITGTGDNLIIVAMKK